uniref:BEN domain-containing protein n=1 Tax=Anopheles culicifacies TaxID=139723 RepID=A0A182MES3_9DIPT
MEQATASVSPTTTDNDQQSVVCPLTTSMADSTVELKFIQSPWATPCLVLNNFLYNCHSTRGDIGYWRCHNYSRKVKEERCRARCVIKNGRLTTDDRTNVEPIEPVCDKAGGGHKFIRSQRGLPLLVRDNFIYRCERTRNYRSYWLCIRYKTNQCKGRIICQKNAVLKETRHCHPDDHSRLNNSVESFVDLSQINIDEWVNCNKYKCRSRVTLKENGVVLCSGKHTHGPETAKIQMGRNMRDSEGQTASINSNGAVALPSRCYLMRQPHSIDATESWPVRLFDDMKPLPKIWYTVPLSFMVNRLGTQNLHFRGYVYVRKKSFHRTINWVCCKTQRKNKTRRSSFRYDLHYEMINNRKGGLNLNFRGYVYRRKTNFSQTTNWVCANPLTSRNDNANSYPGPCAARCITDGAGGIRFSKKWHNHGPITDDAIVLRQGVWLDELPYRVVSDGHGNRMHLQGYTYRKAASFRTTTDWVCVRNAPARDVTACRERRLNDTLNKSAKSDGSDADDSLAVFTTTMRGKEQLVYMGQPFVFEKLVLTHAGQPKKIWRCNQWWNQKCRARVYTIDRHITTLNGYHTHAEIVTRKQRVAKREKTVCSDGTLNSNLKPEMSGCRTTRSSKRAQLKPQSAEDAPKSIQPTDTSKSSSSSHQKPKENRPLTTSKQIPLHDGIKKIIDKVPLHAGSSVYIATKDLLSIYTSKPAVYTGRLIELMFGLDTLKVSCLDGDETPNTGLIPLDSTILNAVITHIVHVFQQQNQRITNAMKKLTTRKGTQLFSMIDNKHVMFSDTPNGGKQLQYKNYIYHRNIQTGNTVYWRCSKAVRLKCKATIVTKDDLMRVNNVEHNHVPMRRLTYGLAIFIAISPERQLIRLRGKLYQKTIGRAYRSVWMCIEYGCPGEIVLRELKGGQIKITSAHNDDCTSDYFKNRPANQIHLNENEITQLELSMANRMIDHVSVAASSVLDLTHYP